MLNHGLPGRCPRHFVLFVAWKCVVPARFVVSFQCNKECDVHIHVGVMFRGVIERMTKEQTTSAPLEMMIRWLLLEVLSSPEILELLDGNIFPVDAERFHVRKFLFIKRFRCAPRTTGTLDLHLSLGVPLRRLRTQCSTRSYTCRRVHCAPACAMWALFEYIVNTLTGVLSGVLSGVYVVVILWSSNRRRQGFGPRSMQ